MRKAAKAAKFNYRLEQSESTITTILHDTPLLLGMMLRGCLWVVLSSHGGAAAVVGSYSSTEQRQQEEEEAENYAMDESRTGDGSRTAVRRCHFPHISGWFLGCWSGRWQWI